MADIQQETVRYRVLTLVATMLFSVSLAAVVIGSALTLFAFSSANTADAAFLIRGGPTMLLGGLFGMSKARRIWRLSRSRSPSPRELYLVRWPVELVFFAGLAALAFMTTRFLLEASPSSATPVTFHGSYFVAHVVPLTFFMRVLGTLLGIRLAPIVAATLAARSAVPPARIAVISGLAALGPATLAYLDSRQFPAMPYVFALFVLDLALAITFATVAIEGLAAQQAVEADGRTSS